MVVMIACEVSARLSAVLAMSTDPCKKAITEPSSTKTGRLLPHAPSPTVTAVTCKCHSLFSVKLLWHQWPISTASVCKYRK